MTPAKKSTPDKKNVTRIRGDVVDSVIVTGNNNQTIIQKFFNIFKSDAETLEQRNRRVLLNHVENAWIKGVLDASLHGAALLDLGIKQDPNAVTQYPWAIQKESTKETLPAGTSMLEIFDSVGMGRSLLILGAPGSGKTTMLLELARRLIARAREDVTQPIPMVFNLASWTEKLTLTDWLAQELNNLYSVPRKTAPDWVKGDKLLLLLDGLDEVRQDSRAKCVEAINEFRKQNGLTSLAVCSRSQDYADLKAKLSFEGAIEVQPLTQEQIAEFFNRFGDEMAGIKQVLNKGSAMREMAETPLFLSIMIMAYRDKKDVDIWVSQDEKAQRKHLFDTYIERMFERRSKILNFKKQEVLHWLSWLATKITENDQMPYILEKMQPTWLSQREQLQYKLIGRQIGLLTLLLMSGVLGKLLGNLEIGLVLGGVLYLNYWLSFGRSEKLKGIEMVDKITWEWKKVLFGLVNGLLVWLVGGLLLWLIGGQPYLSHYRLQYGVVIMLVYGLYNGLGTKPVDETAYPAQKISFSISNSILASLLYGLIGGLGGSLIFGLNFGIGIGVIGGLNVGLSFGYVALIRHYILRFVLGKNNIIPFHLVPFLDHCVDLIFLRRVGGGYIFVHRLLMEHFAEMYFEINPKGDRYGS